MLEGSHCLPQFDGIAFMKKHVKLEHSALLKRYMEKIALDFPLNMNEPLNARMLPQL